MLHGAVLCGQTAIVQLLLSRGADVSLSGTYSDYIYDENRWTKYNGTVIQWARANGTATGRKDDTNKQMKEKKEEEEEEEGICVILAEHAEKYGQYRTRA